MYPKESIPMGSEVLRVENLKVVSPFSSRKNIIEDMSFTLHSGEILGIGGLVGSGRSEAVNAIFGSYPRKSGKVYVYGEDQDVRSPIDAIEHKIGLLTEDRRVITAFQTSSESGSILPREPAIQEQSSCGFLSIPHPLKCLRTTAPR